MKFFYGYKFYESFQIWHLLSRILGLFGPYSKLLERYFDTYMCCFWVVFFSFWVLDVNSCLVKAVVFNRWILWWFRCNFTIFSCSFWTIFWNRDFVALLLVFGSTLTLERQELKQCKACIIQCWDQKLYPKNWQPLNLLLL